jgi:sec-independent protein translocase protein TatA
MEALTPWHLLLILVGFMLLFGYKKLPDATRSLGRSLRIFKSEMHGMAADQPSPGAAAPATAVEENAAPLPSRTAAELDAEAREAEALAAQLRARAAEHAGIQEPGR